MTGASWYGKQTYLQATNGPLLGGHFLKLVSFERFDSLQRRSIYVDQESKRDRYIPLTAGAAWSTSAITWSSLSGLPFISALGDNLEPESGITEGTIPPSTASELPSDIVLWGLWDLPAPLLKRGIVPWPERQRREWARSKCFDAEVSTWKDESEERARLCRGAIVFNLQRPCLFRSFISFHQSQIL